MPVCSSVAFLSLVHRCSVRLPLLCSSAVALLVCRCSARLSLVHCWSARVGVAVLSLSCRCPVAVLSLSCRWSTAGLSARVRGRSSISSVAGLSARVGVADASLMCRWSVSALSLFCRYSARVMVAVTGLSLVHRCHWSVAGSSLLCHWSVAGSSLSLVCRWFIAVTGLLLVHRCSVTGLSLVHRCHWSVAGSSLLCSGHSRWSWSLIVRHSCATALPVPLSAGLSLLSLTCLLEPWSLIRRLSAARLPLVHLIVHRYSSARCSVCLSITGPSLLRLLARRLSVCWPVACLSAGPSLLVRRCSSVACLSAGPSLVHHWPVAARPSLSCLLVCLLARRCSSVADTLLVCLLVHHWLSLSCTCSWSLVCLLVRLLPSPRPSPRPSLVAGPSLVCLLVRLLPSPRPSLVAGPSLVCLLVRLLPSPRPSLVTGRSARVRVAAPWLVCCSSVTYPWLVMVARASARSSRVALPLLRLLVHHWPVCSSVAFLSAVRSPVCLLEPWSLARRSSICCPSLLRLLES